MLFYQILPNFYLGEVIDHPTGHGVEMGFTSKVPPIAADGEYVKWNGRGWELTSEPPPVTQPPPPEPRFITKVAFRFRLTDAEYVGILSAAKTDIEIQAWVETFNMVSVVNLADTRTVDGINKLVEKDLLTTNRANEILTTDVQVNERP